MKHIMSCAPAPPYHARCIFEYCTRKGYGGAYPWMSWLEDAGATSPCNPEMSAEWDRRAAAAAGDKTARTLIANGYETRSVMPPEAQACREKLVN